LFHGIYPALVTPLTSDGVLHVRSFEKLIERVYRAGVHGVYVCGSTGEGQSLPAADRRKVTEIALKNTPAGKQVIVHVGAWSFDEARSLAQHAASKGAAAVSSLRPAKTSFAELIAYYRDLATASDAPFIAYHFPGPGEELSYDQLVELTALPNVVGLKFTDYDLFTLSSLARDGRVVFNGRDEVLAAGLLLGAHGGIGSIYNLAPDEFVSLWEHAQAGRWSEARAVQDNINDLLRVLLRFPFHAALKQSLTWAGIDCGPVLRPRLELSAAQTGELKKALAAFAVLSLA
jgi:N-acetylneuraminate lyase